ncbi:MAG: helix-turn-helix domain-containing protein [Phocaeicola sp.]|uniref:helix-turn-helix domain-containing protein n=1 Tax=Phocaeicola TaxID=909656 RepID=UPI00234EE9DB|nr:helix-turn-helix domain-containing protein [Phocaeicola oris]MCE2616101.1 helix-turn-helix domain-containing protein [Phocaeicola oris]
MASELKKNQKKEWAKLIYLKENITQQEIADRIGVSRITINKWIKEWEDLKLNLLQTREERISSTLAQLDELDRSIAEKEEGKRFPSAAEADIRRKLTADLEALEQDASVRDIYNVSRGLLDWLRQQDLGKAKELSDYFDAYIKEKMKWVK